VAEPRERCEGENSLEPEARISLNYGAKVYLALAPELLELHALFRNLS